MTRPQRKYNTTYSQKIKSLPKLQPSDLRTLSRYQPTLHIHSTHSRFTKKPTVRTKKTPKNNSKKEVIVVLGGILYIGRYRTNQHQFTNDFANELRFLEVQYIVKWKKEKLPNKKSFSEKKSEQTLWIIYSNFSLVTFEVSRRFNDYLHTLVIDVSSIKSVRANHNPSLNESETH